MNIYFACSITGGREFEPVYQAIVAALLADGHQVPTASLAAPRAKAAEGRYSPREVYERDTVWIRACDALVAEVSTPSHGVGYEISYALSLGKPVLCVFQEGRLVSKMLTGNSHPCITVSPYRSTDEAVVLIRGFLADKKHT